jgi:hypothetical protein
VLRGVEVFVQRVGRVDRVELFGGVLAGVLEDDLGAAGVFCPELVGRSVLWFPLRGRRKRCLTWEEVGDVVGLAVDNHPARLLGVVLGDFIPRERHGGGAVDFADKNAV